MDDLFEHKAPSWEYEQEYRDIFDLTRNGLYELEDGFHHIGITSSELKRVILGCYCEKEEADIKRLLNQAGLNSTEVTRAKLSLDKYKIEV